MGLTAFPNGVSSFGMPQLGAGDYFTTGSVFFVNSEATNASDGNAGTSPDRAFATIDAAVGKCTANKGDTIFVMPGHVETLTASGQLVFDVDGITVIGIGHGNARPRVLFDAAAADVDVTGDDVTIRNMVFRASFADVLVGIDLDGLRFWLDQCEFEEEAGDLNFLVVIEAGGAAGTADGLKITNCVGMLPDANAEEFLLIADDMTHLTFVGNHLQMGNTDESVIEFTAGGTVRCLIAHNFISRPGLADADANAFFLSGETDNSGIVAYNVFEANDATAAIGIDLTGAALLENYLISENDLQGIRIPAAT